MTSEEAIKRLKEARNTIQPFLYVDEAIDYAIKALNQEPCEDVISRQAVLEIQAKYAEDVGATKFWQMRDDIKVLPSVTPQPKIGRWIRVDKDKLKCSECDITHFIAQYPQSAKINYCPNCGAKMEKARKNYDE